MGIQKLCCTFADTVDVSADMERGYILLRKTSGISATMQVG